MFTDSFPWMRETRVLDTMTKKEIEDSILHIASGRTSEDDRLVERLKACGLWRKLCLASLWQGATADGEPVHSHTSAIRAILNHTGIQEAGACHLGDAMVEAVGEKAVADALSRAGRRNFSLPAWRYWTRVLGVPARTEDLDESLDTYGWARPAGDALDEPAEEVPWGCIPDTFEGECVGWGCHAETGEVYAIPY